MGIKLENILSTGILCSVLITHMERWKKPILLFHAKLYFSNFWRRMREGNWKAKGQKSVQILSFCLDLAFTVAIYGGHETTEVIKSSITVWRRIKTLITESISKNPRNTMFHMARPDFTVSGGFGWVRNERSGIRIIYSEKVKLCQMQQYGKNGWQVCDLSREDSAQVLKTSHLFCLRIMQYCRLQPIQGLQEFLQSKCFLVAWSWCFS